MFSGNWKENKNAHSLWRLAVANVFDRISRVFEFYWFSMNEQKTKEEKNTKQIKLRFMFTLLLESDIIIAFSSVVGALQRWCGIVDLGQRIKRWVVWSLNIVCLSEAYCVWPNDELHNAPIVAEFVSSLLQPMHEQRTTIDKIDIIRV